MPKGKAKPKAKSNKLLQSLEPLESQPSKRLRKTNGKSLLTGFFFFIILINRF